MWIHGGGWVGGWSGVDYYNGAYLAAHAGAVVVTLNYRLGSLGWLRHSSLADDPSGPTGNWGLLDQVAALQWVHENIGAFGGDRTRVTVGGHSSGAANVADLLVAPGANGLFWRALIHSAPFNESGNDPQRGESWAEDLAKAIQLDDVALLRSADADRIVAAHAHLLEEDPWRGLTHGGAWPNLDPATIPVSPTDKPEAQLHVDVVVGTTRDEATFTVRAGGRRFEPNAAQLRAIVGNLNGVSDPDAVIAQYKALSATGAANGYLDTNALLVQILTEERFRLPTERWARARARAGGNVYLYRVDHVGVDPEAGALHIIDIPLLFGTFRSGAVAQHFVTDTVEARTVMSAMMTRWGAFLHGDGPGWPAVASGGRTIARAVFGGHDGPIQIQHVAAEAV
jgi:para-nitrobenzyl esterase